MVSTLRCAYRADNSLMRANAPAKQTAATGMICLMGAKDEANARQDRLVDVSQSVRGSGSDDSLVSTFAPADHAALTGVLCLSRSQNATGRTAATLLPSSRPPSPGVSEAGSSQG